MPDHTHEIRSLLDSLPYTAPEHMNGVLRSLMVAVDGLLREHGWTPTGLLVNLPEGVTHEEAQAAVDALATKQQPIDIVFTPGEGPDLVFVEVESPPGHGISAGEWVDRGDGYRVLRLP